jgi:hypothetical protein
LGGQQPSAGTPYAEAHKPFTVSVVSNDRGRLCKALRYDAANRCVVSESDAYLSDGHVEELSFASIFEFMTFRKGLEGNRALMMGRPLYPDARIVTQEVLSRTPVARRRNERIMARDRTHMSWSDGPTLVMLDLDRPDEFPAEVRSIAPTTPESWREFLIQCVPALAEAQMAWAPSSSSFLYVNDEQVQGLRGQRFYFPVDTGQAIPRLSKALRDALVLEGMVWFAVSRSGNRLERLPFDFSVFQPERLDFAAGPDCDPPLEWRPTDPITWNDGGAYLHGSDLPATTEADRRRVEARVSQARRAKSDEAKARRAEWRQETGRQIALQTKLDQDSAERLADLAVDQGVLLPEFLLLDSTGHTVSVGQLLEAPEENHGRRFHDPMEPDYRNDPRIAVFLVGEDGQARIYSHAHGGTAWRCEQSVPVVRLRQIERTVDQIHEALEVDQCGLFRNGDALVEVNETNARMLTLDADGVGLRLQRRFRVEKAIRDGVAPADLPPRVLRALLSEVAALPVPSLNAVVRGPYALADGTVVDTPGYNPVSQVYYVADAPYPPQVRGDVGLPEAEEALRRIWHAVRLFPLKSDVDRGILLSAMLTAVARPSLSIAPGYVITAHTAGTGKTLLAQVVGALQTGGAVASSPLPRDEEERRKHLFASLRHGSQFLLYDNAERGLQLDSAVLANLVTSPEIEARVLGVSNVERRPNRLTVMLTGNNLILHGDLNRRLLPINLDAEVEHPWSRVFPFHPVNYVLANWLDLRIAALELIQAWHNQGAPECAGATGFPEWDAVVRSVVVWAGEKIDTDIGFTDPADAIKESYAEDPETEALGQLLRAWWHVFGANEVLIKEVQEVLTGVDGVQFPGDETEETQEASLDLREACAAVLSGGGRTTAHESRRLGMYLSSHEGQIVGGLKFVKCSTRGGARKWRVECVDQAAAARHPRAIAAGAK